MVLVTVSFDIERVQWTREFRVSKGSTILQLKENMLRPKGRKQNVDSFELQWQGHRLHDAGRILGDHKVDFVFIGPEEGTKRAQEDASSEPCRQGVLDWPAIAEAPAMVDHGAPCPPREECAAVIHAPENGQVRELSQDPLVPCEVLVHHPVEAPEDCRADGGQDARASQAASLQDEVLPSSSFEEQKEYGADRGHAVSAPQPSPHTQEPSAAASVMVQAHAVRSEQVTVLSEAPSCTTEREEVSVPSSAQCRTLPGPDSGSPCELPEPLQESEQSTQGYMAGDRVTAQYLSGMWYPARIEKANTDGTFTISWDDDTEEDVIKPSRMLRPLTPRPGKREVTEEEVKAEAPHAGTDAIGETDQEAEEEEVPEERHVVTEEVEARERPEGEREKAEAPDRVESHASAGSVPPASSQVVQRQPSKPPGVTVSVKLDKDLDLSMTFQMEAGATILDVKKRLKRAGEAAEHRLFEFGLGLQSVNPRVLAAPIPDSTVVTERMRLLEPTGPAREERAALTLERALELQGEMVRGFSEPGFRRSLAELKARHGDLAKVRYQKERADLVFTVQKMVLPKYGFPSSRDGVQMMIVAYAPWGLHPDIDSNNKLIASLL